MNTKQPPIRLCGQRPIPSSFLSASSNRESKDGGTIRDSKKNFRVSLSDFLDRKLLKSSELPKTVQGKNRPFSSPVASGSTGLRASNEKQNGVKKGGQEELNCALENLVFEQFKKRRNDKEECESRSGVDEARGHNGGDTQGSRKRRNPFIGGDENNIARKHLVVLGDNPRPRQRFGRDVVISNKKPKPLYNHYANGSGWWDDNREGVDNEEVGSSEVWEGMGSITLGGLDWH